MSHTADARPLARAAGFVPASTPQRLLRMIVLSVLLPLIVAAAWVSWFSGLSATMTRAAANTDQLVRVQAIKAQLLRADALATTAFLVGGQESAEQRAAYDGAIRQADQLIVAAADAQPADREALAELNDQVVRYAGEMEQARSTNRQGLPVGAAYLSAASADLRGEVLSIVDNLIDYNTARINTEARDHLPIWPGLITLAAIAVTVLCQRSVRRRFHRRINLGLTFALIALIAALVIGVLATLATNRTVARIQDGELSTTRRVADVRTAVYDAKANESLTLVARGSGAAYESAWQAQMTGASDTVAALPTAVGQPLTARLVGYRDTHAEIRRLDAAGRWDDAVRLATTSGEQGSTAAVDAFQGTAAESLNQAAEAGRQGLLDTRPGIWIALLGTVLACLVAAGAGARGLERRLKEYR